MTSTVDRLARHVTTKKIPKFGTNATFKKETQGSYDPVTGKTTGAKTVSYTVSAMHVNFSESYMANNEVKDGDILIAVEPTKEPDMSQSVVIDGHTFSIVKIDTVSPGGQPYSYRVHLRR